MPTIDLHGHCWHSSVLAFVDAQEQTMTLLDVIDWLRENFVNLEKEFLVKDENGKAFRPVNMQCGDDRVTLEVRKLFPIRPDG